MALELIISDPKEAKKATAAHKEERDALMKELRSTGVKSIEGIVMTDPIESIDDGED